MREMEMRNIAMQKKQEWRNDERKVRVYKTAVRGIES